MYKTVLWFTLYQNQLTWYAQYMITDVLILAGGFGERLWPASSPEKPKQFMELNGNLSFLQNSIRRALALDIPGKILIITRKDIENESTLQCKRLAVAENTANANKILNDCVVIAEPAGRHTAAAIVTGICFIKKLFENQKRTFLVLTSDHAISPMENFVSDCKKAAVAAEKGKFVCFAIPPESPSVEYGYIKIDEPVEGCDSSFVISHFKEKPDLRTAREYLASGKYFWNSGMFAFDADDFMREMKNCTKEVYDSFAPVFAGKKPCVTKMNDIDVIKDWPEFLKVYETVPKIAVDKAVGEKTANACAVTTTFSWTDIGNWDVFSKMCTDPVNAKVVQKNCSGNFVYSDIPVVLCGVSDLVVVAKNGGLLIMKKGSSDLVREAAKEMK